LPRDTLIHLGLRGVPWHQPRLLVFEASERRLPLKCRSRAPSRGQWREGGLLAAVATLGAPHSADEEHVYCDNVSVVYLSTNPIQHQRMKHAEIDLHFVREHVAIGDVHVLHVPTTSQLANIFTNGLPTSLFSEFRSSLNIRSRYSFDCGGC
jgi:hypothetical protein